MTVASTLAALGLFGGCVDLFHGTEFPTLCDLDASAQGCDAGVDALVAPLATDFCKWTVAEATGHATEACARLAACDTPVGENATGSCIAHATLAYDCVTNPNMPVKGAAHDYWDHLWRARTCDDVDDAVFGGKPNGCVIVSGATAFTACDRTARVDCETSGGRLFGESCASAGRACHAFATSAGDCLGTDGYACKGARCDPSGAAHVCSDAGTDIGFDCASFGAGACANAGDAGPACVPSGATRACEASGAVTCEGNVAVGCPTGAEVRVDCATLTGKCTPTFDGRGFDVSRACTIPRVNDAGGCREDVCAGSALVACVRGAPSLPIDCIALKLGACRTFTTADGVRAACAAP